MLLAASLLAFSLTNSPAQACITPTQTGIYRIIATTKDSSDASVGLVLLENVGNCLEASIIADDGAPAMIENIALKDNVLTGRTCARATPRSRCGSRRKSSPARSSRPGSRGS